MAQEEADVAELTPVEAVPSGAKMIDLGSVRRPEYRFTYTTGPFTLPQNTHSLDWGVLNNDSDAQKIRVTVFKCNLGAVKTVEPPGPLELTLQPDETTHNANSAVGGFFYEIQVEANSREVFPYAAAWPGAIGDPIAGTVTKSAEFIRHMR